MESAPKISQDNTEKPKDSIADKLKKWAKIGAITTVGFLPLEDAQAGNVLINENNKAEREAKIDSLINEIKKVGNKTDLEIDDMRNATEDAHKNYDEQKEWLKDVIGSEEYKKRLLKELDFDEKAADAYIELRKENLNDKDYNLKFGSMIEDGVVGQYNHDDKLVHLATNPPKGREASGIHEFTHDITDGGVSISPKAEDLLTKSFNFELVKEKLGETTAAYLYSATERDARKKVLEYDLEKLGVKKYGEEFKQEHYEKAVELMKEGKLSANSVEFILMTKPDYFLQIMNEIAENPNSTDESHLKA